MMVAMNVVSGRVSPIGLDVGSEWVKAAQFRRCGRGWHLAGCARFPRAEPGVPPSAAELAEIGAILGRQGLIGRVVNVAAQPEKLKGGLLELPARAPGVPLERIARAEFARVHKQPDADAVELSWWELPVTGRPGKGMQVMAVGYDHADAEQQLAALESAGFVAGAVDTMTSALARACAGAPVAAGSATSAPTSEAVLDLGAAAATLVLVGNGTVTYERRIVEGGMMRLMTALQAQAGGSREAAERIVADPGLARRGDADAAPDEYRDLIARHVDVVIEEIRRTLVYAEHQYPDLPVRRVWLSGGGAGIGGLAEYVTAALQIEVRLATAEHWAAGGSPDLLRRTGPSLAAAVGLARFS